MGELLEIEFERLDEKSLGRLVKRLGLDPNFGQSTGFEQIPIAAMTVGEVTLTNAAVGIYPYENLKDLEISVDHPKSVIFLKQVCCAVAALAEALAIQKWGVGLEPLDDQATLYASNLGHGPIWPK